jgi:hypothetical protein
VLKHMSETSEKRRPGVITSEGGTEGPQEYQRREELA